MENTNQTNLDYIEQLCKKYENKRDYIQGYYLKHIVSWKPWHKVCWTEEYKKGRDYYLLLNAGVNKCEDLTVNFSKYTFFKERIRSKAIWKKIISFRQDNKGYANDISAVLQEITSFELELATKMHLIETQKRHNFWQTFIASGVSLLAFFLSVLSILYAMKVP